MDLFFFSCNVRAVPDHQKFCRRNAVIIIGDELVLWDSETPKRTLLRIRNI